MKVLLTGGAGFIGSHTAVELLQAGHEVVVADNLCNSKPEVLARVKQITGKETAFYPIDVSQKEPLSQLFREQHIDAVVHFAGLKAVGQSVEQPLRYYRNNLDATLTLLEVMEEFGVKQLVFSSSATVYGIPEVVPLREGMPTSCTNPYGWTKLMVEQILGDLCVADQNLSVVLLRYFNPIGAHESGLIGEDPGGIPNNLLPYIAQVASGKLERVRVFGNDYPTADGTGVRDYIHVVDLAKGHIKALEYSEKHTGCETFNLGTGKGYSVLEMIHAFETANQVKVPYEIIGRRAGDVAECYADPEKAQRVLGWRAQKTLEDMCRDSWRWEQSQK